jgi:hypothetical protein
MVVEVAGGHPKLDLILSMVGHLRRCSMADTWAVCLTSGKCTSTLSKPTIGPFELSIATYLHHSDWTAK